MTQRRSHIDPHAGALRGSRGPQRVAAAALTPRSSVDVIESLRHHRARSLIERRRTAEPPLPHRMHLTTTPRKNGNPQGPGAGDADGRQPGAARGRWGRNV